MRRQVEERDGLDRRRQDVREHGRAGLRGRQADVGLAKLGQVGGVARRQQRVGERAQRHAIVEEARAAAHHRVARRARRPREAEPRRHVVRVRGHGVEVLQVVAQAEVERQPVADLPLVLRVAADVGVALRDDRLPEGLREAGVVVDAEQEVGHRRERVGPAHRARKGDRVVVVEEVDARAQRVRTRLVRQVVDQLVHVIEAALRAARQGAERRHARDAHRRTDRDRWAAP